MAVVLGWLVSRFGFSWLRQVEVDPFAVLPGFALALANAFDLSRALLRGMVSVPKTAFVLGALADSLPYWLLREGTGAPLTVSGPWDARVWAASGSAALILWFCLVGCSRLGRGVPPRGRRRSTRHDAAWLVGGAILAVVSFRTAQALMGHLPNEERSLYLAGFEIHHAYQGVVALVLLQVLLITRCLPVLRGLFILVGAAAGAMLDQSFYVCLLDCSDTAYNGTISWLGAIAGCGVYAAVVLGTLLVCEKAGTVIGQPSGVAGLLAHRVRGFGEVEHSPSGFCRAILAGVPYLEVDTRASRDGRLFVYHDPATGAGTRPAFCFPESDAAVIRAARLANNEPLLTLEEALSAFAARATLDQRLCLDIKDYGFEAEHLAAVRQARVEDRVCFVSWIPQSLLRLADLGTTAPLILSHLNTLVLGGCGRLLERCLPTRPLSFGRMVLMGPAGVTDPLERLARGYQHALVCQVLPERLISTLARSGGGICVPRWAICGALQTYGREHQLQLWVFSVATPRGFQRCLARSGINVVFSDDALAVLGSVASTSLRGKSQPP